MFNHLYSSLFFALFAILLLNYANSELEKSGEVNDSCSAPTDFKCKSGKCTKKAYICNNIADCGVGDNSDEEDCGK